MRTNKPNEHNSQLIFDLNHEPITVSMNVEHNSVVTNDARVSELLLHLAGRFPFGLLGDPVPRLARFLALRLVKISLPRSRHATQAATGVPFRQL
jgi:hypothetical protein